MADDMTQHKCNNIKCYVLNFKDYIKVILFDIYSKRNREYREYFYK